MRRLHRRRGAPDRRRQHDGLRAARRRRADRRKATNCIIAATAAEVRIDPHEWPCIRCGDCALVCPSRLLPQDLLVAAHDLRLRRARDARPARLHRVRLLRRHLSVPHHADGALSHREARRRGARAHVASRRRGKSSRCGSSNPPRLTLGRSSACRVIMRRVLYALAPGGALPHVVLRLRLAVNFALAAAAALLDGRRRAAPARPRHAPRAARRQRARHGGAAVVRVAAARAVLDPAARQRRSRSRSRSSSMAASARTCSIRRWSATCSCCFRFPSR